MMNLSGVVRSFAIAGGLTVNRPAAGGRGGADGLYAPGATSQVLLDPVAVTPASGKQLEVLPEGLRTRRALILYSDDPIQGPSEVSNLKGDRFTYDGDTFEVQRLSNWAPNAAYYEALAVKVDPS